MWFACTDKSVHLEERFVTIVPINQVVSFNHDWISRKTSVCWRKIHEVVEHLDSKAFLWNRFVVHTILRHRSDGLSRADGIGEYAGAFGLSSRNDGL